MHACRKWVVHRPWFAARAACAMDFVDLLLWLLECAEVAFRYGCEWLRDLAIDLLRELALGFLRTLGTALVLFEFFF